MKAGVLGLVIVMVTAPAVAQQKKTIQCWTDKSGQRMCGDRVPPEYAGQKRDVIQGGRVVDTKKGARTPEEIAEEQRKAKEAVETRQRAEYDRSLLETYRSAKDIEAMRNERVGFLDGRIQAAEKAMVGNEKTLEDLRGRVAAAQKDNKPVPERLTKQIREYEHSLAASQRSETKLRQERADVCSKFSRDLERFQALRGDPTKVETACPEYVSPVGSDGKTILSQPPSADATEQVLGK